MSHVPYPDNYSNPFFAYGIFKPGQIAFSKIEKYVKEISYCSINYKMKIRDGVPIIGEEENEKSKTYGYLIYFKEDKKIKAYQIISETEPFDLYYWDSIELKNNVECNVLKGIKPQLGSSNPEYDINEFKGHNDPLFREALDLIQNFLNTKKTINSNDNQFEESIKYFFNLQMHYMLLWSSIERFTCLKYNKSFLENRKEFSKEKVFKKSFEKNFSGKRIIYTTDTLQYFSLSADKYYQSMGYYYKMRCNIVHRGKTVTQDEKMLKKSLRELLNIFVDVLNETFNLVNVDGFYFKIPYGLKEVSGGNDSIRIFRKDETNIIKGIPEYSIKIMNLDDVKKNEDIDSNCIINVRKKAFYIQIIGENINKKDIIRKMIN